MSNIPIYNKDQTKMVWLFHKKLPIENELQEPICRQGCWIRVHDWAVLDKFRVVLCRAPTNKHKLELSLLFIMIN